MPQEPTLINWKQKIHTDYGIKMDVLDDPIWEKYPPDWEDVHRRLAVTDQFDRKLDREKWRLAELVLFAGSKNCVEAAINAGKIDSKGHYAANWTLTPTELAATGGQRETLEYLKIIGCDLKMTHNERNPLFYAAISGDKPTIKFLIDNGCDQFIRDKHGLTNLHASAWSGNLVTIQYFIELGINPYVAKHDGATIFSIVEGYKRQEAQEWLSDPEKIKVFNANGVKQRYADIEKLLYKNQKWDSYPDYSKIISYLCYAVMSIDEKKNTTTFIPWLVDRYTMDLSQPILERTILTCIRLIDDPNTPQREKGKLREDWKYILDHQHTIPHTRTLVFDYVLDLPREVRKQFLEVANIPNSTIGNFFRQGSDQKKWEEKISEALANINAGLSPRGAVKQQSIDNHDHARMFKSVKEDKSAKEEETKKPAPDGFEL